MRKQPVTEQAPETIRKPNDPTGKAEDQRDTALSRPGHVTTNVLAQSTSGAGHGIELFSLRRPCG